MKHDAPQAVTIKQRTAQASQCARVSVGVTFSAQCLPVLNGIVIVGDDLLQLCAQRRGQRCAPLIEGHEAIHNVSQRPVALVFLLKGLKITVALRVQQLQQCKMACDAQLLRRCGQQQHARDDLG